MDLDKLRVFYYAAQAKSFTNSGLNLSPSAISRHISDLEFRLKTKLFNRHPKGLSLTREGEMLLESCHKVFKELEEAQERISSEDKKPEGTLRVTTPAGWISNLMIRILKEFLDENPKIRLSIKSMDSVPDFSRNETDIAMLPFIPDHTELGSEHLLTLHLQLYASPAYLQKFGVPKKVSDLAHHRLVSYGEHQHQIANINWHLALGLPDGKQHEPYMTVNNLYYAGESGYGIITLAEENVLLQEGKLVPVLPDVMGPVVEAYCVFPKRLENSKRVKAFCHFIQQVARKNNWI
jgi:DNA-binding transcriptional LysR family regulator